MFSTVQVEQYCTDKKDEALARLIGDANFLVQREIVYFLRNTTLKPSDFPKTEALLAQLKPKLEQDPLNVEVIQSCQNLEELLLILEHKVADDIPYNNFQAAIVANKIDQVKAVFAKLDVFYSSYACRAQLYANKIFSLLNRKDSCLNNALHLAAPHYELFKLLLQQLSQKNKINLLVQVNYPEQNTPLVMAIQNKVTSVVRLILKVFDLEARIAYVHKKNQHEKSAYRVAEQLASEGLSEEKQIIFDTLKNFLTRPVMGPKAAFWTSKKATAPVYEDLEVLLNTGDEEEESAQERIYDNLL